MRLLPRLATPGLALAALFVPAAAQAQTPSNAATLAPVVITANPLGSDALTTARVGNGESPSAARISRCQGATSTAR